MNLAKSSNDMSQSDLPSESPNRPGGGSQFSNINSMADQFHFFVKLPLEIQLKIWEFICLIPRVVDVFSSGTGCEALHNLDDNFHNLFGGDLRVDFNATHCHPPTVLHVCQNSRRVGLQFYTLAFGKGPFSATPPTSSNISFSCQINMPAHIYVNWGSDVVCPMGTESRDMKDMEVQLLETTVSSGNLLRHLAIDPLTLEILVGMDSMDSSDEGPELSWAHLLMDCPRLEEIILYHLPDSYPIHGTPLELSDISEVDVERGVGFKVPELKKVRDVIMNLIGMMNLSQKATNVKLQELSMVREVSVPLVVRIMGVRTREN